MCMKERNRVIEPLSRRKGRQQAQQSESCLAWWAFLPPILPHVSLSPLMVGPCVESEGRGMEYLGWREKLFQKCPVTPTEEGALFGFSDDAGAAFPLPVI